MNSLRGIASGSSISRFTDVYGRVIRAGFGSMLDQKPISWKIHANDVVGKEIVANETVEPGR